jgi:hypothetical protein
VCCFTYMSCMLTRPVFDAVEHLAAQFAAISIMLMRLAKRQLCLASVCTMSMSYQYAIPNCVLAQCR